MTNTKNTKRALLSSVLALLLCFTMLLGTTFAWFTDEVASANNVITSGNLDVVLEYKTNWNDEWTPVTAETLLFDDQALYEPGYTEIVFLRVSNAGSLALKYNLMFNLKNEIAGINVYGDEFKLSDYLEFGSYRMDEYNGDANYADILMPIMFGSRESALTNAPMTTLSEANPMLVENAPVLVGENTAQVFALVLSMPESVGNEANAKPETAAPTFDFGVSLLATQLTAENDSFGNDYDIEASLPNLVTDAADLATALTANDETITVSLSYDIDLPITSLGSQTPGSGEYKLGGADTEMIVIDLNGHELNITTTYWSGIGAVNPDATIVIKNGAMTSSQPSGTWNSYDLTFANCDYVIEDVVFEKAIAFSNEGKNVSMTNVTINETHDYYAMWITAEGQNVSIDGLTINSDGRGIKIDEQYVSAAEKVTLSISNAMFDTNKKAAIVVKSVAGADITLDNIDINGVASDPFNAVWVDEDSAAYANFVTVVGGKLAVEGSADIPTANSIAADTTVTMGSVITAGGTTVVNNAGTIDLSGKPNLNGGNVVINGGTVVTTSANYTGLQHSGEVTYNGVTFNGSTFCYGEKVVFNNCTFNLTSNYIWTYGAEEVEFNNCTFNTDGKAILVYTESSTTDKVVTINSCTFNATASGFAGAIPSQPCAAVEIDSSLVSGTYTVNFVGENVIDSDFSGLVRIKAGADKNNVTINGATPVVLP